MNNRIKELAEQAASAVREQHNNAYWRIQDERIEDSAWRKKFAELIVKECLDACDENNKSYYAHVGIAACVKSIKHRFGVE